MTTASPKPVLLVIADEVAGDHISDLFSTRGFVVKCFSRVDVFADEYLAAAAAGAAAIVDCHRKDAERILSLLHMQRPRPVLVGIVTADELRAVQDRLDAAFERPVDPARLFARVVGLIADRKRSLAAPVAGERKRKLSGSQATITGVIGVVRGNSLFHRVAEELHTVIPPVNAGAILEKVLQELGSDPFRWTTADLAAMLASHRLTAALAPFGEPTGIQVVVKRIEHLLQTIG